MNPPASLVATIVADVVGLRDVTVGGFDVRAFVVTCVDIAVRHHDALGGARELFIRADQAF